jgi:DNA-binding transcriptional regulator YbjK
VSTASTPKGERRRQELIEAAADLFARKGFDAVRHRAVAERAGLPLASTTYYFDSLDELVFAAVEHYGRDELAKGRRRAEELPDRRRGIDAVAELILEQLLGDPAGEPDEDFDAVLLRYERLVVTGRRAYLRPLMRTLGEELRELLSQILRRSGFRLDRPQLERLIAVVDGAVVNALIEVNPEPREAARRMLLAELTGPRPPAGA